MIYRLKRFLLRWIYKTENIPVLKIPIQNDFDRTVCVYCSRKDEAIVLKRLDAYLTSTEHLEHMKQYMDRHGLIGCSGWHNHSSEEVEF